MAFDFSKLSGLIVEKFKTRRAFARAIDWSGARVSARLNGKVPFSTDEIRLWCDVLGIPDDKVTVYFFTLKVR